MSHKKHDVVQITDPKHKWFPMLAVVEEGEEESSRGRVMIKIYCFDEDPKQERDVQIAVAPVFIKPEQIEYIGRVIMIPK